MADEPRGRQYSSTEVEEILRRALERPTEGGMTREELLVVAREAGISEESVGAAADELERDQGSREVIDGIKAQKREGFIRHFSAFAIVNSGLFLMNLATSLATSTDQVPRWWFLFPFLGWGLALGLHAARLYVRPEPSEAEVQRALAHEAEARAKSEARRKAESFERRVEEGVEAVLARLERVLDSPSSPKATETLEVRVSDDSQRGEPSKPRSEGEEAREEAHREKTGERTEGRE